MKKKCRKPLGLLGPGAARRAKTRGALAKVPPRPPAGREARGGQGYLVLFVVCISPRQKELCFCSHVKIGLGLLCSWGSRGGGLVPWLAIVVSPGALPGTDVGPWEGSPRSSAPFRYGPQGELRS